MRVALTVCISMRSLSRQFALLLAATAALGSVACSGANDQPTYTSTDIEVGATAEDHDAVRCESGTLRDCTIFLGRHGDLSNCIHGVDVCADGAWMGCVDEATMSENPDLYGDLLGE
jgi:hypothetical protein